MNYRKDIIIDWIDENIPWDELKKDFPYKYWWNHDDVLNHYYKKNKEQVIEKMIKESEEE